MQEVRSRQGGFPGETRQPELFEYGIHLEKSDIRAHVSVINKTIYVFQTKLGIEAIERTNPKIVPAGQPGFKGITAMGWLVRPDDIRDIRRIKFHTWDGWKKFNKELSTSEKGALAVECVIRVIRMGRFPFWLDSDEDRRENIQISGTDIVIFCRKKIQVKCDYDSGESPGTGFLFLQKAEINPFKRI